MKLEELLHNFHGSLLKSLAAFVAVFLDLLRLYFLLEFTAGDGRGERDTGG